MNLRSLFLATTLLHAYVAFRLVPDLWRAWPVLAALVLAWFALSAWLLPQPLRGRRGKPAAGRALHWCGYLAMGAFSWLLVFTLLRDVALFFGWIAIAAGWQAPDLPWRAASAAAVLAASAVASVAAVVQARSTARVRRVTVALEGLPPALQGFRIAQLSDLHVGETIRRGYIERIVARTNALQADVVAITGDLVDGSVEALRPHVAPLAQLSARHGVYVVTGNHEYYAGAQPWVDELRRMGLTVLMNEHVLLAPTPGAAAADSLLLAGVSDLSAAHYIPAHASAPAAALRGAPPRVGTRVLLAHQPRSVTAAAQAGFHLQLSGHTHGGQFWPWNYFVPLQNPVVAGLHRIAGMWLYVSCGTGYWGPPMRLGAPSEITLLTLTAAP